MSYDGPAIGTAGDTYLDTMLAEYTPPNEGLIQDLLTDETKQLLYALLVEMRARRQAEGRGDIQSALIDELDVPEDDREGLYSSVSVGAPTGGDWAEVDLDFMATEIDLRFGGNIEVAFADETSEGNRIQYDGSEAPVAGISVKTSYVYVRSRSGSVETVDIEAWSDDYR